MKQRVNPFQSAVLSLGAALILATLAFSGCGLTRTGKEARFLDAGKKALTEKDYARAIIQFRNAARTNQGDAEPHYEMGLAYIEMGDYLAGRDALKRALALKPGHAQAKAKLAALLATFGSDKGRQEAEGLAR